MTNISSQISSTENVAISLSGGLGSNRSFRYLSVHTSYLLKNLFIVKITDNINHGSRTWDASKRILPSAEGRCSTEPWSNWEQGPIKCCRFHAPFRNPPRIEPQNPSNVNSGLKEQTVQLWEATCQPKKWYHLHPCVGYKDWKTKPAIKPAWGSTALSSLGSNITQPSHVGNAKIPHIPSTWDELIGPKDHGAKGVKGTDHQLCRPSLESKGGGG